LVEFSNLINRLFFEIKNWIDGLLDFWSFGLLEFWIVGVLGEEKLVSI